MNGEQTLNHLQDCLCTVTSFYTTTVYNVCEGTQNVLKNGSIDQAFMVLAILAVSLFFFFFLGILLIIILQ